MTLAPTDTGVVQVSTTTDSADAAADLAETLLEQRLAACVQVVGPVTSRYRWEGEVRTATEFLCLIKTTDAALADLVTVLRTEHGYELPEITVTPVVAGEEGYLAWVRGEIREPRH